MKSGVRQDRGVLGRYLVEVMRTVSEGQAQSQPQFEDKVGTLVGEVDALSKDTKNPNDLNKTLKAGVIEREFSDQDIIDLINRISVRPEPYWKDVFERFMLFIR